MKKQVFLITCFIVFFLLIQGLFAFTARDKVEKQIDFRSGGLIDIRNTNGSIEVEGWEKDFVVIKAEKRAQASGKHRAERLLKEIQIEINRDNDEITIVTHLPRNQSRGFLDWIFGGGGSCSVSYHLFVPRQSNLEVKTTNGAISAAVIEGKLNFRTTNGKIRGKELAGRVNAHTTNGSIGLDFNKLFSDNDMGFFTTNGSIKVFLPDNVKCRIRAKTTNGSLSTDFPLKIKGKYTSKRIMGEINGGGALLEFVTTNGSIRINRK